MASWLYDSHGRPVAFLSGKDVFSRRGKWLGELEGKEVWKGKYIGEIVKGDYLLARHGHPHSVKGTPGTPGTPGIPGIPGTRGSSGLPAGYSDIELED
jgi:hypothetical protein